MTSTDINSLILTRDEAEVIYELLSENLNDLLESEYNLYMKVLTWINSRNK